MSLHSGAAMVAVAIAAVGSLWLPALADKMNPTVRAGKRPAGRSSGMPGTSASIQQPIPEDKQREWSVAQRHASVLAGPAAQPSKEAMTKAVPLQLAVDALCNAIGKVKKQRSLTADESKKLWDLAVRLQDSIKAVPLRGPYRVDELNAATGLPKGLGCALRVILSYKFAMELFDKRVKSHECVRGCGCAPSCCWNGSDCKDCEEHRCELEKAYCSKGKNCFDPAPASNGMCECGCFRYFCADGRRCASATKATAATKKWFLCQGLCACSRPALHCSQGKNCFGPAYASANGATDAAETELLRQGRCACNQPALYCSQGKECSAYKGRRYWSHERS